MESVVTALNALYGADPEARIAANDWLQDYQKQPDAWSTSNVLLTSAETPTEAKLFAAQTFRSKITYDLGDLTIENRLALRDSLKSALQVPHLSTAVVRQVALSLSDLLLQLPEWISAVREMVEQMVSDTTASNALLEFLIVLPEEVTQNGRIEVTNETILSEESASTVMSLLPMYLDPQAPPRLRKQAFLCFASWLRAGAIPAKVTAASPLFALAFDSLTSDDLYDEASSAVCDLIHETQEIQDNMDVISQIVTRLTALHPSLAQHSDDADRSRALGRVFAEAGEVYTPLIVKHAAWFQPIVESIAQCARNEDLDVVRLTFSFWWKLSEAIRDTPKTADSATLVQTFAQLVDDVILHLRYPSDAEGPMTAEERDDFREFRHHIGDTLKDCCAVLGAVACLSRANDLVQAALNDFAGAGSWQAVEAPLFAMRSMGASVDMKDEQVMPSIMETLTRLPPHPRIRYAAILVIARYTAWINQHPQHIPFQLTFISSGFSDADSDVWLASAQAMKFLCEDCGEHLVPYVPQLHAFVQNVGSKLPPEDLAEVSEGIAYVISVMPPAQLIQALPLFCLPILEQIKGYIPLDIAKSKADTLALDDTLQRLSKYLEVCTTRKVELPPSCAQTAVEAWAIFDELLLRHGHLRGVSENGCAVLRRGLDFFDLLLLPLLPKIAARLASAFTTSGRSAYLWITGRLPDIAHRGPSEELAEALRATFETETAKVVELLPQKQLAENEDVIDDYCHLTPPFLRYTPDIVLLSPQLRSAIAIGVSALNLLNPQVIRIGLDVLLDFTGHDVLEANRPSTPQSTSLRSAVLSEGQAMTHACIGGIISEWEDTTGAITLLRILAERFPSELLVWVPNALEGVSAKALALADRTKFLHDFNAAMTAGHLNDVRTSFVQLDRLSRRAKQRAALDRRRTQLDGV